VFDALTHSLKPGRLPEQGLPAVGQASEAISAVSVVPAITDFLTMLRQYVGYRKEAEVVRPNYPYPLVAEKASVSADAGEVGMEPLQMIGNRHH
jgi:hypothetical protein